MITVDPGTDLAILAGTVRARRRPSTVQVRFADAAGAVDTREGRVAHPAGAAILTGTRGEHWPVERQRFEQTYAPVPPTVMGKDGIYRRIPSTVLARRYEAPFEVALSAGRGTLRGHAGDWLVQYAPGDLAVIGAEVFDDTYEVG